MTDSSKSPRRAVLNHRSIMVGMTFRARDIFVRGEQGTAEPRRIMRTSLQNFYFLAQAETPFSSNFLSLISKSEQVAEVTRFSRKTFLGNSDFSRLLRLLSPVFLPPPAGDGMIYRDDRPRWKVCRCSRRIRPGRRILLTCSSRFSGLLPRIPPHGSMRQPWLMLIKTSFIRVSMRRRIRESKGESKWAIGRLEA